MAAALATYKEDAQHAVADGKASFLFILISVGLLIILPLPSVVLPSLCWLVGLAFVASVYSRYKAGHVNTAVSAGFFIGGDLSFLGLVLYVVAQFVGMWLAFTVLVFMTTQSLNPAGARQFVVTTSADVSVWEVMVVEALGTFCLVSVVLAAKGSIAGLFIGAILGLMVLFFGPVSGGSFNPARALVPLLMANPEAPELRFTLIAYVAGPLMGAVPAALLFRLFKDSESQS